MLMCAEVVSAFLLQLLIFLRKMNFLPRCEHVTSPEVEFIMGRRRDGTLGRVLLITY